MSYKKYLFIGIPILFIVGSIFHFIYEWSGNNFIIGLISPINESIWEHLKLVLLPTTIYWVIYPYFNQNIVKGRWLLSLFISIISAMLTIVSFYCVYTGAFGFESLILDMFSLLLGLTIGQLIGSHFYTYGFDIPKYIPKLLIILLFIIFILFTITPPGLPIFQS